MRKNALGVCSAVAAVAVAGAAGTVQGASWATYTSGLVDAGPSPWQPTYPNFRYESFANLVANHSSGTMSQTIGTNADARATYFAAESTGTLAGYTRLTTSVSVTGDLLRRIDGALANGEGPNGSDVLTSTTVGVSLAWYVMDLTGGTPTVWISNASNRLDLNTIRNNGVFSFDVALEASNFVGFNSGGPQGGLSFENTLASGQYFGLLVTTATASGNDFDGMNITQWINEDTGGWNPYAQQRNSNYGAFSEGSTTINLFNAAAVPGHGVAALISAAGLLGARRRRR